MPCHGKPDGVHDARQADRDQGSQQASQQKAPPCCTSGRCSCDCVATSIPIEFAYAWAVLPAYPGTIEFNAPYVPSQRFAVSLRPPIA